MPKVVVHTIVSAMTKAAAAANTGWQRADSHSNSGNTKAIGSTVSQDWCGKKMRIALINAMAASAAIPSRASLGDGGSRAAAATPTINGATVTIPSASDATQCSHVVRIGAVDPWNNLNPRVPPTPEMAAANTAAASNPKTFRRRSRLKPEPNCLWMRPAASIASPTLQRADVAAIRNVLSPNKLANIVAAAAPIATGHRTLGPSAIKAPTAMPFAGQNTATPSGAVSSERLSRAARK